LVGEHMPSSCFLLSPLHLNNFQQHNFRAAQIPEYEPSAYSLPNALGLFRLQRIKR
jgi:hypothetical protein